MGSSPECMSTISLDTEITQWENVPHNAAIVCSLDTAKYRYKIQYFL